MDGTTQTESEGAIMAMYPFKNLVFEGGGVKGIAYLGMLEVLESENILPKVKRVAGASAGAIMATASSFGLPFSELKALADTLNYKKVPEKAELKRVKILPRFVRKELEKLFGDVSCVLRLVERYGWYSSNYFYGWLKRIIAKQFNNRKGPPFTFADFQNAALHKSGKPFSDLYVIGADITNRCSRVFSAKTTPKVEVATAVRISMSIPLFFESIKFMYPDTPSKHVFSDGGTMRNYPINLFDNSKFGGTAGKPGNPQTLGGHLFTAEDDRKERRITNLVGYIENLFESLLQVQEDTFAHSPDDVRRTVNIDSMGVKSTNFNIKPGDRTYRKLYNSGKRATEDYLKNYKPPS